MRAMFVDGRTKVPQGRRNKEVDISLRPEISVSNGPRVSVFREPRPDSSSPLSSPHACRSERKTAEDSGRVQVAYIIVPW